MIAQYNNISAIHDITIILKNTFNFINWVSYINYKTISIFGLLWILKKNEFWNEGVINYYYLYFSGHPLVYPDTNFEIWNETICVISRMKACLNWLLFLKKVTKPLVFKNNHIMIKICVFTPILYVTKAFLWYIHFQYKLLLCLELKPLRSNKMNLTLTLRLPLRKRFHYWLSKYMLKLRTQFFLANVDPTLSSSSSSKKKKKLVSKKWTNYMSTPYSCLHIQFL